MVDFNKKLEEYQATQSARMTLVKLLGFDSLGYDNQHIIFNKARMFGWTGDYPGVLGSHTANKALDEAIDYLIQQGATFKKESNK